MAALHEYGLTAEVRVDGSWQPTREDDATVVAVDPRRGEKLWSYPRSMWSSLDTALTAGRAAFTDLQAVDRRTLHDFLADFAQRLDDDADRICEVASLESGLPADARFRGVELPRTTNQLRQAAVAARDRTWTMPTIDPDQRVASMYEPIPGVVFTIGPNNFPLAFNAVAGGDAAAAFATGHPVLAKGHPAHPATTEFLARHCADAAAATGLPDSTLQLIYDVDPADGCRVAADRRLAATAFTGSAAAGHQLKAAGDAAGKPVYVEMGSVNPIVLLDGALGDDAVASTVAGSVLLAGGQFCTKPGLVLAPGGAAGDRFVDALASAVREAGTQTMLSQGVRDALREGSGRFAAAGARLLAESDVEEAGGWQAPARLFAVDAEGFLDNRDVLGREVFGSAALVVRYANLDELHALLEALPGSLVASVFCADDGSDDSALRPVLARLRGRVGRIAFNKPPTGVLVSPAMNHGGPYPATGHPGFTAVGIPASLRRFGHLQCYDNADPRLLPPELQADNPLHLQRLVAGVWTDAPCSWEKTA